MQDLAPSSRLAQGAPALMSASHVCPGRPGYMLANPARQIVYQPTSWPRAHCAYVITPANGVRIKSSGVGNWRLKSLAARRSCNG